MFQLLVNGYYDVILFKCVFCVSRSNVDNQILKAGFTSREIVIMENDDPGGVFEFSPSSRGPWLINVSGLELPAKNLTMLPPFYCIIKNLISSKFFLHRRAKLWSCMWSEPMGSF